MKKIPPPFILILAVVTLFTASCEKVIDIDLNEKNPHIVIEGIISDHPGPYLVRISTTVNFDDANEFPPVSGAEVIITDDQAGADTLIEVKPGLYQTNTLQGIYGHTYTLSVKTPFGGYYTSVSRMPELVPYDSLTVDSLSFFGTTSITFTPYYMDPPAMGNRYRFIVSRNNITLNDVIVFEDKFNNGLMNTRPIIVGEEWVSGDSARIEKQDIDQGTYDYFNTLSLASDGSSPAPANPTSNISNGALGYFSAITTQIKTVTIP